MTASVAEADLVARLRHAVATAVFERASAGLAATGRRLDRDDQAALARSVLEEELERHARACLDAGEAVLGPEHERRLSTEVLQRMFDLGRFQPLLDDELVMNVHANGCDVVFVEYADGTKVEGPPVADSDAELIELLREIGRRHGLSEREFNPSRPQLNLQLPDGSRLFAIAWVCARPCVALRRHRHLRVDMEDLLRLEMFDAPLGQLLAAAVRARVRILIGGPTGAGKTTLLRAMASQIPPSERIVTIESELELGLDRYRDLHPDCIAFEAREANVEGAGEVSCADLVRSSLRANPDRVIVGEVRGSEVVPMLNAMSQGNDGSMCTIHADSSAGVFHKLALYAVQAPERLPMEATMQLAAKAVDLVVYASKTPHGRRVTSVRHVAGFDGSQVITNELYRAGPDGRAVPAVPVPTELLDRLVAAGYDPGVRRGRVAAMTLVSALAGAGVGLGLCLVVDGLRRRPRPTPPRRRPASPEHWHRRLALAGAAGLAGLALTRWPVAAVALAGAGWCWPDLARSRGEHDRETARTEAVAAWTEMLRDTMSGAHGLEDAVVTTASVAPAAIAPEVAALAVRLERQPLDVALRAFADDLAHPTGDLVVASLTLAARGSVGDLGGLLGTLAEAARDEAGMRLRVHAARARLRTAVRVIAACTADTGLGLVVLNRRYLHVYDTASGQAVLALVVACWAVSLRWLSRLGRFVAPERFLAAAPGEVGR